jgi:hypothetical protein
VLPGLPCWVSAQRLTGMWNSGSTRLALTPPASYVNSSGESRESLVAQIKELQKTDPSAKEQWIAYTDMSGQGTRDPMKHTQEFLEGFLTQLHSGSKLTVHEDARVLGDIVKLMQRKSTHFKNIWAHYCSKFGGGKNDPAKHDGAYLVKFFEYLAQTASLVTSPMTPMAFAPVEHPMKRMRDTSGGCMTVGMDSEKEALVMSIKSFQRLGTQQKETWGGYADKYLGGVRDPSRHDVATLQEFINQHGVEQVAPAASGPGRSWGPMSMGGMDMDSLVQRIKQYQKGSTEQRDAWYSFCGGTRDPARHSADKLQEFISLFSVP